jgi:hypothetical protein
LYQYPITNQNTFTCISKSNRNEVTIKDNVNLSSWSSPPRKASSLSASKKKWCLSYGTRHLFTIFKIPATNLYSE